MHYSTTVGIDLAKNVIQVSVVNGRGKETLNPVSYTHLRAHETKTRISGGGLWV